MSDGQKRQQQLSKRYQADRAKESRFYQSFLRVALSKALKK